MDCLRELLATVSGKCELSHLCLYHHYNYPLYPYCLCPCSWASGGVPFCNGDIAYRESLFQGIVVEESLLCQFPCVGGAASVGMAGGVACVRSTPHRSHKKEVQAVSVSGCGGQGGEPWSRPVWKLEIEHMSGSAIKHTHTCTIHS